MKTLTYVLVALSLAGCGNKKTKDAEKVVAGPEVHASPATPEPTAAPPAPAAIDAKALVGAWTKKDDAKIVWTFKDDGTVQTKTSFKDFANHYTVDGAALTIKSDEALPEKHYTVTSLNEHQLVVKDTEYGVTSEFAK